MFNVRSAVLFFILSYMASSVDSTQLVGRDSTHPVHQPTLNNPSSQSLDSLLNQPILKLAQLLDENRQLRLHSLSTQIPISITANLSPLPKRENFTDSQSFTDALIDAYFDPLLLRIKSLQQENDRIRRLIFGKANPVIKVMERVARMTVESVSVTKESPKVTLDGAKLPHIDALLNKPLQELERLLKENIILKKELPSLSLPAVTSLMLPPLPKRGDFSDSQSFIDALIDAYFDPMLLRIKSVQQENEMIQRLILGKTNPIAKPKETVVATMSKEATAVVVEAKVSAVTRATNRDTPVASRRLDPSLRERDPRTNSAPALGSQSSFGTPKLQRGSKSESTAALKKEGGKYGEIKGSLTREVATIIHDDAASKVDHESTLKMAIEKRLKAFETVFKKAKVGDARDALIKSLNRCATFEDIQDTLAEEVKVRAVEIAGPQKSGAQMEEEREKRKREEEAKIAEEEREKQLKRIYHAIKPQVIDQLGEEEKDELEKNIIILFDASKTGNLLVQGPPDNPLAPLITLIEEITAPGAIHKLFKEFLDLLENQRETRVRLEKSTTTINYVLRGDFIFCKGMHCFNSIPNHGENLESFENDFYEYIQCDSSNSELQKLLTSPNSGIFGCNTTNELSNYGGTFPHRKIILKMKHLVMVPVSLTGRGILTPAHYTSKLVYSRMNILETQYQELLALKSCLDHLWFFPSSLIGETKGCVFALNLDTHDVISFNFAMKSEVSSTIELHWRRATKLASQPRVFNNEL